MRRSKGISILRPKSSFSRVQVRARTASGSLKFSLQDNEEREKKVQRERERQKVTERHRVIERERENKKKP